MNQIETQFANQIKEECEESIQRGITLSGPHRDELRMKINGKDISFYGSRGQTRTTIITLKLAELTWIRNLIHESPVLLLDEVFAELDTNRQEYLLDQFKDIPQVILTITSPEFLLKKSSYPIDFYQVTQGQILPIV